MPRVPAPAPALIPVLAGLAACTVPIAPAAAPPPRLAAEGGAQPEAAHEEGPCRSAGASMAIGQFFDEALGERAREAAGAEFLRVIRPGDAVTMDWRPERLNLELDAAGRVSGARCG
jgi:hypothetical protein